MGKENMGWFRVRLKGWVGFATPDLGLNSIVECITVRSYSVP